MYNINYAPWNGRIQEINHGSVRGAWIARVSNQNQWIQIDLESNTRVKGIATQGRYDANQWVTKYKLFYGSQPGKLTVYREGRNPMVRETVHVLPIRRVLNLKRKSGKKIELKIEKLK
jgi:hypothetical protein